MPDELREGLADLQDAFWECGVDALLSQTDEADDLIATLASGIASTAPAPPSSPPTRGSASSSARRSGCGITSTNAGWMPPSSSSSTALHRPSLWTSGP